jgi:ATP-dependent RNA helicase RhlE
MQFSDFNLHERLARAVVSLGYTTPTPIQKKTIPVIMEGLDLIGTAATGTGKTAAFMLPLLHLLLQDQTRMRSPRILVITPTRELAEQIKDVTKSLGRHTTLRCSVVYGGVGFQPQVKALKDGTEIIVCCPGRMLDHMKQGNVDLSKIEAVVLDEADRMLDMGFLPNIKQILNALPADRQTLLFSATFAPELLDLVKQYLREPRRVSVAHEAPAETIDHCFYPVRSRQKTPLLIELLKTLKRTSVLVFTRTKHRANLLVEDLQKENFTVGVLHANKSQNARKAALDAFRSGKIEILVATDIAARGIDVAGISHVVNYDIPDTASNYIHRIGRTGRAEKQGDAMTFICDEDMQEVREIERRLGKPVQRKTHPSFNYAASDPVGRDHRPNPNRDRGFRPQHGKPRTNQNRQDGNRQENSRPSRPPFREQERSNRFERTSPKRKGLVKPFGNRFSSGNR